MHRPSAIASLALFAALVALGAGIAIGISARRSEPSGAESGATEPDVAPERTPAGTRARTPESVPRASRKRPSAPARAPFDGRGADESVEPATLEGSVVNRLDGAPVAGVSVFVTDDPESFRVDGPKEAPPPGPLRTESDASGAFRLDAVPPGRFGLVAFGSGFVSAKALRLDLDPGESRTGLVVEVEPWTAVSGIVVDRGGLAVPHAMVTARRKLERGEDEDAVAESRSATADASGQFVVALPRGGRFDLTAEQEGFLPGAARDVSVAVGEETRDVVISLSRGGTVRGTVSTPDGTPAIGVSVTLGEAAPRAAFGGIDPPGDEALAAIPERLLTRTSEAGEFVFTTVPTGRRPLAIDVEGFLPWSRDYVKIEEGIEHAPIVAVLDAGLSIRGRITDDTGSALPGAVVTAEAFRGGPRRAAATDELGLYAVTGLADREYRLEVEAAGVEFGIRARVRAGRENEDFALRRRGTIVGVVLKPDGTPCTSRFLVKALRRKAPATASRGETEELFGNDGTFTDPNGRFELRGAPPGTSRVTASAPEFCESEPAAVSLDAGGTSAEVVLVLRHAGEVEGRVVSAAHGAPIEGAFVFLGALGDLPRAFQLTTFEPNAMSSADGFFRIENVAPGSREISVLHPRFVSAENWKVEVEPGAPRQPIVIRMKEGGSVAGRVYDAGGYPAEGVSIEVLDASLEVRRRTVTDSAGAYDCGGLAAGRHHVVMRSARAGARNRLVDVKLGQATRLDLLEAGDGPRVTGVVSDAGVPVAGAVVVAAIPPTWSAADPSRDTTRASVPIQATRTDDDGAFSLSELAPGLYEVQVLAHRGARPFSDVVAVPKGRDLAIELVVPFGGFEGRVLDRKSREPLPGIAVRAFSASPAGPNRPVAMAETDAEGGYRFERLPPGTYRAEAAPPERRERDEKGARPYARAKSEAIVVEDETLTRDVDFALEKP